MVAVAQRPRATCGAHGSARAAYVRDDAGGCGNPTFVGHKASHRAPYFRTTSSASRPLASIRHVPLP
jgi:hypothetical protein